MERCPVTYINPYFPARDLSMNLRHEIHISDSNPEQVGQKIEGQAHLDYSRGLLS